MNAERNSYDRIKPTHPSESEVSELLEHYQKGSNKPTEMLARGLAQKYPNHQLGWKILGIVLRRTRRLEEALAANLKAVDLLPHDYEAHSNLGTTLKELGRLHEAEKSYKKALAIKRDFEQAHFNLGITLQELGKVDEAITSYQEAIAINSHYAKAHNNLGILLQKKKSPLLRS